MVKWAQHEFGINFKIKWIVSPSLFIVQFTIDKMIYSPFLKRFCCLGSRRIRFPVWFLTSCSLTEPSSMALHYLLCITSCLPWKLPEVSHKVSIYLNLLCITLLVMESSCSVPPGTNLHNFLYRGSFTTCISQTSTSDAQGSNILNLSISSYMFLKCSTRYYYLILVTETSRCVPPGTNILNFLNITICFQKCPTKCFLALPHFDFFSKFRSYGVWEMIVNEFDPREEPGQDLKEQVSGKILSCYWVNQI